MNGINAEQLALITEEIWDSVLGIKLSSATSAPMPEKKVSACVHIVGEGWDGALRLDCSEELVRMAGAACMGVPPENLQPEQIQDTAGELANMTGGNLGHLLPSAASLSLPSVAEGINFSLHIPHSDLVAESAFSYGSSSLVVSVFERAS